MEIHETERSEFEFLDPGPLVDGDLELVLASAKPCDTRRGLVPQYEFELRLSRYNHQDRRCQIEKFA